VEEDVELVELLCAIDSGLTNWEKKFIDSIAAQVLDEDKRLSENQRTTGEKILSEIERR